MMVTFRPVGGLYGNTDPLSPLFHHVYARITRPRSKARQQIVSGIARVCWV